ncbi:MAG TPA: hypothetical protein VMW27_17350 [Thermoanaerobaculia bacterium]|nr:hypothetical protein [Thermoanaerobaculia bacterium]
MPSTAPSVHALPASWRRLLLALTLVLLTVVALALLQKMLPPFEARLFLPTHGAQWIWSARARDSQEPSAFYAVRDFMLDQPPAKARLQVLADEEYVLYLNGRRVGANGYRPGAALDVYEVGPLLLPGGNRLLAELRSSHGAGGFLLTLEDPGSGKTLVETDELWRTFDRYYLGLLRGWLPLGVEGLGPPGEPAFCWGVPPLGRWGRPKIGPEKPAFAALAPGEPVPGVRRLRPGAQRLPGGARVVYDWGREVTGYLSIELTPSPKDLQVGLLFVGDSPPEPWRDRSAGVVLLMPDQTDWTAAQPRRFRYAMVVGVEEPLAVEVHPLDPRLDAKRVAALLPDGKPEKGVFGVAPPPLRTPVEDEVWRKLQGFAGVAGGKEL